MRRVRDDSPASPPPLPTLPSSYSLYAGQSCTSSEGTLWGYFQYIVTPGSVRPSQTLLNMYLVYFNTISWRSLSML